MSRKPLAALGLAAAAATGISFATPGIASAASVPAASTAPPATYTVQPGDSFWAIGQRFGDSMYAVAAANGMAITATIFPGQVLAIPAPGTVAAAPAPAPVTPAAAPAPVTRASAPVKAAAPAATATAPSGLEQCIISRESGGNAQARNGAYWGLYQFSRSTWAAYGGKPGSYGSASASEQQQVFHNAVARGGASNWTPYDGC